MKGFVTAICCLIILLAVCSRVPGQCQIPDESPTAQIPNGPLEEFYERLRTRETRSAQLPIYQEPRVIKKGILAPSLGDRLAHQQFLKQSKTGVIRLMPREVYDTNKYQGHPDLPRGGGSYFSFFYRSHSYGHGSDIELQRNQFAVGFAGADYGMLVSLEDIPIDAIPTNDPRLLFMRKYKRKTQVDDARSEFQRFRSGVNLDGFTYKSTLPVRINTTYLVRSIVLGRSDILAAFRVTRLDSDGSAILAWKLLSRVSLDRIDLFRN